LIVYPNDHEHPVWVHQPPDLYGNQTLRTNRWYSIEMRCAMNTIGQADGQIAIWTDGYKVFEDPAREIRTNPATFWRTARGLLYHGGQIVYPVGSMHYRIAKLAASTKYIGVPRELLVTASGSAK
jgi:hypothetical protein